MPLTGVSPSTAELLEEARRAEREGAAILASLAEEDSPDQFEVEAVAVLPHFACGTVRCYDALRGFGTIDAPGIDTSVLFLYSDLAPSLLLRSSLDGRKVHFDLQASSGGQARAVCLRPAEAEATAPPSSHVLYKVVARVGGRLVSIFDGETEYRIGFPTGQAAGAGPRYFAYATLEETYACPFPRASRCARGDGSSSTTLVVLAVAGLGWPLYHGRGKFSFPGLLPVAVFPHAGRYSQQRWRC